MVAIPPDAIARVTLVMRDVAILVTAAYIVYLAWCWRRGYFISFAKVAKAAELHRKLMPIFSGLFIVSNPIPVKYAVNQVGFKVGKPRPPLYEPDEKTAAQIMDIVKKCKIDLPV